MQQQLLSAGQVARLLGVQGYQIGYAHSTGRLAEPAYRVINKRLYTPADVRRVAAHFGLDPDRIGGPDAGEGGL